MQVMIPVPLVLPETPIAFAEVEALVEAWSRAATQAAHALAWAAQAALEAEAPCPRCGGVTVAAGHKPRRIETMAGGVTVHRARRRCPGCGRCFQPGDDRLRAALGTGQLTPRLREVVVLCGASWPYRQAAEVVGRLRGAPLAPETVRAAVARVGARVAATQQAEATQACRPGSGTVPTGAVPPPAVLVAELDGAWVRATDTPGGREVKVGVVHGGSDLVGRTRRALTRRRYVATARGVDRFAESLTAAVVRVDGYAAPEQLILGDGAAWIWRTAAAIFPDATQVLDRWHLRQARRRALRAALPDRTARATWTERIENHLEVGDVPGALAVLGALQAVAPHAALDEFVGYLTHLAPRIPDYASRRAAGQRIGSGGIEKACDLVVNRRCKGKRGMRWRSDRIEDLLALRLTVLNAEWHTTTAAWSVP